MFVAKFVAKFVTYRKTVRHKFDVKLTLSRQFCEFIEELSYKVIGEHLIIDLLILRNNPQQYVELGVSLYKILWAYGLTSLSAPETVNLDV